MVAIVTVENGLIDASILARGHARKMGPLMGATQWTATGPDGTERSKTKNN